MQQETGKGTSLQLSEAHPSQAVITHQLSLVGQRQRNGEQCHVLGGKFCRAVGIRRARSLTAWRGLLSGEDLFHGVKWCTCPHKRMQ